MYKNFSLNDNEKKEIMEMHKSHGYKKPINEEFGGEGPEALKGAELFGIDHTKLEVNITRADLSMVVAIARKWCKGKDNFPDCQEVDNLYRKHYLYM